MPFHPASHHGEREERIAQFAQINKYHVSLLPYFLEKLKNIEEGDSNLLDKTLIIYGSPMGNSNVHNHKRCPLFLAGHASGMLKGNLHLKAPDGTPMANVLLTLLHGLGARRRAELRRQHGDVRFERGCRNDGNGGLGLQAHWGMELEGSRRRPDVALVGSRLHTVAISGRGDAAGCRRVRARRRRQRVRALLKRAPTSTPRRATA